MNSPAKTSQYVRLDARHAAEQDALGQPRFTPGERLVRINRCYAHDGDAAIWVPETPAIYFIVEAHDQLGRVGSWVNRLRFNGPAQMKEFLIEALDAAPERHQEITDELCELVVSMKNPLAGRVLSLRVEQPKSSGYFHHVWRRVTPEVAKAF